MVRVRRFYSPILVIPDLITILLSANANRGWSKDQYYLKLFDFDRGEVFHNFDAVFSRGLQISGNMFCSLGRDLRRIL